MLRLKLSAIASAEIATAIAHYSAISPRLANSFNTQLHRAITLLRTNPLAGSLRFAHLFPSHVVRVWTLDRFPYRLLYYVKDATLHVHRLSHERTNLGSAL